MLTKLTIKLKNTNNYGYEISSLLHGVLMQKLPGDYAEKLHISELKPYTQHIERDGDKLDWVITAFTDEADSKIPEALQSLESVSLEHKNCSMDVLEKNINRISYEGLLEKTYFARCPRRLRIEFLTPTAFKVGGRYQFYPTVEHIMKSLISKHDSMSSDTSIYDDKLMDQINENVSITGYRLRSVRFPLEGITLPAFMGSVTLSVRGPQQFVNLINMICLFGEYSGVGIKTAIGMGAVKVLQLKGKE